MTDASIPFHPATPAIIVGHSATADVPPLGLGEPFALLGGDRLGSSGIPFTGEPRLAAPPFLLP